MSIASITPSLPSSRGPSKKDKPYSDALQRVCELSCKVLLGLAGAYALGKMCQKSKWLRYSLTQSCFFYGLFQVIKKELFIGFLAMSSSFFIAKGCGIEEESYQLCDKFLKAFQRGLMQSDVVGKAFVSFAQCADCGFSNLEDNKGLPVLMGISTTSLLVYLFELNNEKLFRRKSIETIQKVTCKVSAVTLGGLIGGICAKNFSLS